MLCTPTRRRKSAPISSYHDFLGVKLWQIILSAVTTGGFIAAVFGAGKIGALVGVLVSTFLLVLNAYTKNYDLGELSQKHRQAGADLWIIRERVPFPHHGLANGGETHRKVAGRAGQSP